MLKKINDIHYKDLFLYGFYGSYIAITSIAAIIDFLIPNYFDAVIDLISVVITTFAFKYYLKTKDRVLASIILFWIASVVIFMFVLHNNFNISIIFTLLIPMVAFILLPTREMVIHVGIYFLLLGAMFAYGYAIHDSHSLLYSIQNMSAYFIALLFVIAFGTFYHIAIERSYVELEHANLQKTFLLKEIHHRVKNNLNLISSILGIQGLNSNSEEVHTLIKQNKLRLESIALGHEMLYKQENLHDIEFKDYVSKLTEHILHINEAADNISINIEMVSLKLPIESMIQFGIIINELMINSIKYGFNKTEGEVNLKLEDIGDRLIFTYSDNGVGFDIDRTKKGFGINLVEMTVAQLDAKMSMQNSNGIVYKIEFQKSETL